jgi:hypothetical protein
MAKQSNLGTVLLLVAAPPLAYVAWRAWDDHAKARKDDKTKDGARGAGAGSPSTSDATSAPPAGAPPPMPAASSAPPAPPSAPPRAPTPAPTPRVATAPVPTAKLGRKLTTSTVGADGRVSPSPSELLAQARAIDPAITLDELAGARLIATYHAQGTLIEWCCLVDMELNRAEATHQSLYAQLVGVDRVFGVPSTSQDAYEGHITATRAVLDGTARGIAGGATHFLDPAAADHEAARYLALRAAPGPKPTLPPACDALTHLERLSFDYETKNGCELHRSQVGPQPLAWIGPIPGVDATRLLLLAPMPVSDPRHFARYQQAYALIYNARSARKAA